MISLWILLFSFAKFVFYHQSSSHLVSHAFNRKKPCYLKILIWFRYCCCSYWCCCCSCRDSLIFSSCCLHILDYDLNYYHHHYPRYEYLAINAHSFLHHRRPALRLLDYYHHDHILLQNILLTLLHFHLILLLDLPFRSIPNLHLLLIIHCVPLILSHLTPFQVNLVHVHFLHILPLNSLHHLPLKIHLNLFLFIPAHFHSLKLSGVAGEFRSSGCYLLAWKVILKDFVSNPHHRFLESHSFRNVFRYYHKLFLHFR